MKDRSPWQQQKHVVLLQISNNITKWLETGILRHLTGSLHCRAKKHSHIIKHI